MSRPLARNIRLDTLDTDLHCQRWHCKVNEGQDNADIPFDPGVLVYAITNLTGEVLAAGAILPATEKTIHHIELEEPTQ